MISIHGTPSSSAYQPDIQDWSDGELVNQYLSRGMLRPSDGIDRVAQRHTFAKAHPRPHDLLPALARNSEALLQPRAWKCTPHSKPVVIYSGAVAMECPATANLRRRFRSLAGESAGQPSIVLIKSAMPLTPFESAFMMHLIADWLLQNEWMSVNKVQLTHPAAWVHGGIHAVLLGLVLGWAGGATLGLLHVLVDSRFPIRWWIRVFKKCDKSPDLPILLIGCDQVLHLACLAGWMVLAERWN